MRLLVVIFAGIALFLPQAGAHTPNNPADAVSIRRDGRLTLDLTFDVPAYILNDTTARIGDPPMNELLDGPVENISEGLTDAQARLSRAVIISADEHPLPTRIVSF